MVATYNYGSAYSTNLQIHDSIWVVIAVSATTSHTTHALVKKHFCQNKGLFLPMTKASLYVKIALYVKVTLQKTLPRNKINVAFMVSDSLQYVSESHANLYSTRIFFKK